MGKNKYVPVMLKKVNTLTDGKKSAKLSRQSPVKPYIVKDLYFFLKKELKDDFVLLNCKNGFNFLLIKEERPVAG
jgi:hypothetical protein